MQIDVYSSSGAKVKSLELPTSLFGAPINWGLMHQAVVRQQANRRQSPAHVLKRGEVWGSTKKLFAQKHTGQARRGDIRSPLLRGGGKTFGPRNDRNFTKDMPKKMRHAALRSCLSLQASKGAIVGLDSYPETIKTKDAAALLQKLPFEQGRRVLIVTGGKHLGMHMSVRNLQNVKTIYASYLNPEDILNARGIVFLTDAIQAADTLFGKNQGTQEHQENVGAGEKKTTKKAPTSKTGKTLDSKKASSSLSAEARSAKADASS